METEFNATPATPSTRQISSAKGRSRLLIALFAVCGAVLVTIGAIFLLQDRSQSPQANDIITKIQHTPALRVIVSAKRSSMVINGNSTAQIFIVPRATASENSNKPLQFDAILTQPGDVHTETYILLNNRAYWSTSKSNVVIDSGCIDPSQVPPISLMQSSLENARAVDRVIIDESSTAVNCEGGSWLELSFVGETFVFCTTNTNQLSYAVSEDLDITVEYLVDPTQVPEIHVPLSAEASRGAPLDCPLIQVDLPSFVAPTTLSHETNVEISLKKSSCGCKGPKKPCLFMHGVGEKSSGPLLSRDKSGWGNIQDHAPCCSTVKFAQIDTVSRGWDDIPLQDDFCNAALQVASSNSGKTIGKLILVTHSMGNLIAGGAVANGRCLMSKDVTWVSLAGPMKGSKSANLLEQKCASGGWGDLAIKGILKLIGYCPIQRAYLHLKHQATVDATLQARYAAAQKARSNHLSKVLCAKSSTGLWTIEAVALGIVGALSHHDTANDGVVDFDSCSASMTTNSFGSSPTSTHYKAAVNHLDASFRNGDGWWGSDRKPVKWFECSL